jgi:hypothetical protein
VKIDENTGDMRVLEVNVRIIILRPLLWCIMICWVYNEDSESVTYPIKTIYLLAYFIRNDLVIHAATALKAGPKVHEVQHVLQSA